MEKYVFLKNYFISEGVVSHNVFYYQPFSITRYQGRFYAKNYFEYVPIVSTALSFYILYFFSLASPMKKGKFTQMFYILTFSC